MLNLRFRFCLVCPCRSDFVAPSPRHPTRLLCDLRSTSATYFVGSSFVPEAKLLACVFTGVIFSSVPILPTAVILVWFVCDFLHFPAYQRVSSLVFISNFICNQMTSTNIDYDYDVQDYEYLQEFLLQRDESILNRIPPTEAERQQMLLKSY